MAFTEDIDPFALGLKNQTSIESNPFDKLDDDLINLTSGGDLDDFLGNEDQGRSASFINP